MLHQLCPNVTHLIFRGDTGNGFRGLPVCWYYSTFYSDFGLTLLSISVTYNFLSALVAALPRSRAGQPAAGDRSRRRRRRRLSTSDEDEEDENSSSEEAEEDTRERASGGDSNNARSENAHVDDQAHGQVSEQKLQQQALIDGDREAGGHETGASEVGSIDPAADLPAVDTFIVFEWIDYENKNNLKKTQSKKGEEL
eukprot:g41591.t1